MPPAVGCKHGAFYHGHFYPQNWLPTSPRERSYQPLQKCPVERGATRVARHVREELLGAIPGQVLTGSNPQILLHDVLIPEEVGRLGNAPLKRSRAV